MQPGTRLEHYEIIEPIGEGGMGAVYRAEDTKLRRAVAIKVLPPELSGDPERLARLEREAQLLATMSHPNVATVHGLGQETLEEDGRQRPVTFLVMELVPGPSLHERLAEGPLPWREAVEIAVGIASALEAAHDRGIVHRDLKPANVHVDDDGGVKVLDFGLAKAYEDEPASASLELSASPTAAAATRTGMILGTASYMSPEQARGKEVDRRTDVWALGCVLYEMLTGRKAFDGETVSDVLASILKEEPDLEALPPVPVRLRHLLERCLAREPGRRMHDVADVRIELEAAREERPRPAAEAATPGSPFLPAAAAALALVVGLIAGFFLWSDSAPGREMRLIVSSGGVSQGPDPLAVSPDGRWIAETGVTSGIRVRALDDYGWRQIPGTEGANSLAFSPDGRRLYFTRAPESQENAGLYSVGLDGATPTPEGEMEPGQVAPTVFRGLDGTIMTGGWKPDRSYAIYRHEPGAGLTEVARGNHDSFLGVVAQIASDRWLGWTFALDGSGAGLILIGEDPADNVALLEGYRTPRWLGDGRILAIDGQGRLVAATIDPRTGAVVEPPAIQLEGLGLASSVAGAYDVSAAGTLVYMAGPADDAAGQQAPAWMDLSGGVEVFSERRGFYDVDSRVSPSGDHLALEVSSPASEEVSIWIHEIGRDLQTALAPGLESSFPVWSPGGDELAFSAGGEDRGIYRVPIDRSEAPESLLEAPEDGFLLPMDWSPDGSLLLYVDSSLRTRAPVAERNDLWLLPLDGSEPRPFLATEATEIDGRFSPDGRWIAYASDRTGRGEIWVRSAEGGDAYRISADGGTSPEWNPTGGQIFFQRGNDLMVVDIDASGATPSVSAERVLTRFPGNARPGLWHPHPDGERFLIAVVGDDETSAERSIRVILDWPPLQQ